MSPEHGRASPVLPWRLVAGVFLHCVVPLYLAALLIDIALGPRSLGSTAAVLHEVLRISPALLGGYAGLAVLAIMAAALLDPWLRRRQVLRQARDPRAAGGRSQARLRQAAAAGRGRFGPRADAALVRLEGGLWDHADPGQQALTRDLAETVTSAAAALASAPPDRREAIAAMAADAIERIAGAQQEFATIVARRDEEQVQLLSRYVENRYGASDFASGVD